MSNRKSPDQPRRNLYEALERMEQEIPLLPEEQDKLLREANYDVDAGLKEVTAMFDQADVDAKRARLATDAARNLAEFGKAAVTAVRRTRDENLARIRELLARLPEGTPQLAYFRNFESAPDGDLDSLVADLEALVPKK